MHALTLAAALAATPAAAHPCGSRHLATVEPDGRVSAGARQAVVDAALSGASLRVGWEHGARAAPTIVHWQDARFVSIFEGEVFTQVGDTHRQSGVVGQKRIDLSRDPITWRASLGTDGRLLHRFDTDPEPKEARVVSHWCLAR
ncbi:MAG: hypothetical protein JHD15_11385 [Phenylobacterium sp.]|jgi:hypothetical protein|uniref:hypothetical protein n=1 Tax=Phenylobacterium sp. TaxID=1871053 RepID=UPI001A1B92EB|nr:hypothetical protein [Phenylobacterium sp.]MBJ7410946.1 hypothetical protein [Phenylobacterium sp.]